MIPPDKPVPTLESVKESVERAVKHADDLVRAWGMVQTPEEVIKVLRAAKEGSLIESLEYTLGFYIAGKGISGQPEWLDVWFIRFLIKLDYITYLLPPPGMSSSMMGYRKLITTSRGNEKLSELESA